MLPNEVARNPDALQLAEPLREQMRQIVHENMGAVQAEFLIESGEPVDTILKVAREQNADLIALGIRNAFIPSVQLRSSITYRLISGPHCAVLTYRSVDH